MVSELNFGFMIRGDRPDKAHFKALSGRPGDAHGDVNP